VTVAFSPSGTKEALNELEISYAGGTSPPSILLAGSFTSNALLSFTPSYFAYGAPASPVDQTFTLSNTGLTTSGALAPTTLAAPFSYKDGAYPGTGGTCSTSALSMAASCTIVVTYTPPNGAASPFAASNLEIDYDNGAGTTQQAFLALSAGALGLAELTIARSTGADTCPSCTWDYGPVTHGSSADHTFTVTNVGDITATNIADAGGLFTPFSYDTGGSCGTSLAPQQSCTLVIHFAPTTLGFFDADLALAYDVTEGARSMADEGVTGQSD
jgi:hypothetical protein